MRRLLAWPGRLPARPPRLRLEVTGPAAVWLARSLAGVIGELEASDQVAALNVNVLCADGNFVVYSARASEDGITRSVFAGDGGDMDRLVAAQDAVLVEVPGVVP